MVGREEREGARARDEDPAEGGGFALGMGTGVVMAARLGRTLGRTTVLLGLGSSYRCRFRVLRLSEMADQRQCM